MLTTESNSVTMQSATEAVIVAALELPEEARFRVLVELIESFDSEETCSADEHQRLWSAEIQRRLSDYDAGRIEAVPFEVVLSELRARYQP